MTWWQELQQAYLDGIQQMDRTARRDFERAFDSGATTPAEIQAAIDREIASIEDPSLRAARIADLDRLRADLESNLRGSDYHGDLSSLTLAELTALEAARQRFALTADARVPTSSADSAATAAQAVGGNHGIDPETGEIEIFNLDGKLHERIAPGEEGRPAPIVAGELQIGSEPGGPRPLPADISAAIDALADSGWDPHNPGDAGIAYEEDGDVVATFPDGSIRVFQHDDMRQTLADLEASAGRPRDIADALDRGATQLGSAAIDNFNNLLGSFGWPGLGDLGTGAAGLAGSGGANATTGGSSTSTDQPATRPGSQTTGATSGWDSSLEPDDLGTTPRVTSSGSKPAGGTNTTTGSGTGEGETNEIVDRTDGDEPVQPDDDDGYSPSTIPPPTDGTYAWDERRDDGSDEDDEDDTTDDDDDDEDDSSTDAGYTPAPDGEARKVPTAEEWERIVAAAEARIGWSDGVPMKAPEWDPAFARMLQERKEAMIGNPGDPDLDTGTGGGGFVPPDTVPVPDPDDDTPGHNSDGVDNGSEDPTQQHVQTPLGSGFLGGDSAASLAPQEMVTAELDPGASAPLEVAVAAEINVVGTPEIPGYLQAIGDPVSGAPEPEDPPEALFAMTDARIGAPLMLPDSFRSAARDAEDDDLDAG